MKAILEHIRSLESYVERSGVRVVRTCLPESVLGRAFRGFIALRADLDPELQLSTLVHELAHWLAHRDAQDCAQRTIFEYEAEAVEALVMSRLGLPQPALASTGPLDDEPTDGLLRASVTRVIWASGHICSALGLPQRLNSEP